jgi:hypothetical protein
MKALPFVLALLASSSVLSAQISIGIRIGPPPPPREVRVLPPNPGPDFLWVEGYWYPVGNHYKWHDGYWSRAPYSGAHWVAPHHDGDRFFEGYWEGDRGRTAHDHHWDRDRDRDYREHDRDRDRDRDHREHDRDGDRDRDRH